MLVQRAYNTELDLNDRQMTACRRHAGAARWAYNWGLQVKQQLLYKAGWYGARVVLADRWEPSSKRCSRCGWLDADLTLSDRTFHCEQCGLVRDRDLNAAINLEKLAGSSPDSQNACGAVSAGARSGPRVKLAAVKQEPNAEHGLSILG
jgi:putative transposase